MADDEHIEIEASLDDNVSEPAKRVSESIDDIGDKSEKSSVFVDALEHALHELAEELRAVRRDSAGAKKGIKDVGDESVKTSAKVSLADKLFQTIDKRLNKLKHSGADFGKILSTIRWPFIIQGVTLLARAVSGLAAAGTAVVSALLPATGAIVALPALVLSAATGIGVFSQSLGGLSDALKVMNDPNISPAELNRQLSQLDPTTRNLAVQINKLNTGPMKEMRKNSKEIIAPSLLEGLSAVNGLMPIFVQGMKGVAKSEAETIKNAAKLVETPMFKKDFKAIMANNTRLIGYGGDAMLHFGNAAKNTYVAALPLLEWFGKSTNLASKHLDAMIADARATGKLGEFFEHTKTAVHDLWQILKNLGQALFHVFAIGDSSGEQMLQRLVDLTGKFNEWTKSAQGRNAIKEWFEEGQRVAGAFGHLISSIFTEFKSVSSGTDLVSLINKIADDFVPAVGRLISDLNDADTIGTIVDLVSGLSEEIAQGAGAYTAFFTTLKTIVDLIAWIIENVPGASTILGAFLVTLGTWRALKLTGLASALAGIATGIGGISKFGAPGGGLEGVSKGMGGTAAAAGSLAGFIPVIAAGLIGVVTLAQSAAKEQEKLVTDAKDSVNHIGDAGAEGVEAAKELSRIIDKYNKDGLSVSTTGETFSPDFKALNAFKDQIRENLEGLGATKQGIKDVNQALMDYVITEGKYGKNSDQAHAALDRFVNSMKGASTNADSLSGATKTLSTDLDNVGKTRTTKLVGDLHDLQGKVAEANENLKHLPPKKQVELQAKIDDAQEKINQVYQQLANLHNKTVTVNVSTIYRDPGTSVKVSSGLPGRAEGGSVTADFLSWVGEKGPEAYITNSGKMRIIGSDGPEVMKFPESGYVVPNDVITGSGSSSHKDAANDFISNLVSHANSESLAFAQRGRSPELMYENKDTHVHITINGGDVNEVRKVIRQELFKSKNDSERKIKR